MSIIYFKTSFKKSVSMIIIKMGKVVHGYCPLRRRNQRLLLAPRPSRLQALFHIPSLSVPETFTPSPIKFQLEPPSLE